MSIQHMNDTAQSNIVNKLNFRAILVPIIISVLLLIIKTYGWIVTGSLSILSSLLDSTLDIIISLLNMVAVLYAAKPPDHEHRFGHNSIEDIVGLVQATFIAASGLFILYEAVYRFIIASPINNADIGIWVMMVSMIAPLIIIYYQKLVINKTKSVVVEADRLHYLTDFLMNGVIIISLFLVSKTGLFILDPILASIIAIYIMLTAIKIAKKSFDSLMDHELENNEKDKIRKLIKNDKNIKGCHALKTRRSGSRVFVQLHIDLDKRLSLKEAHDIADRLEKKIIKLWHQTDIIIHKDPV